MISLDWSLAVHVSAPDANGWAFVETYTPSDPSPTSGNWPKFTNEILQVRLDGSEVRRIAHHRSRPFDSYYYTPRTSSSHDGKKLVFSSNMGLQQILGYPSLYTDTLHDRRRSGYFNADHDPDDYDDNSRRRRPPQQQLQLLQLPRRPRQPPR
jgi:hypothetical protein